MAIIHLQMTVLMDNVENVKCYQYVSNLSHVHWRITINKPYMGLHNEQIVMGLLNPENKVDIWIT